MRQTIDYNNTFDTDFDLAKAFNYLRNFRGRRLAVYFYPSYEQWIGTPYPKEAMEYNNEGDEFIEKYIEWSQQELIDEIPF